MKHIKSNQLKSRRQEFWLEEDSGEEETPLIGEDDALLEFHAIAKDRRRFGFKCGHDGWEPIVRDIRPRKNKRFSEGLYFFDNSAWPNCEL